MYILYEIQYLWAEIEKINSLHDLFPKQRLRLGFLLVFNRIRLVSRQPPFLPAVVARRRRVAPL